MSIPYMTPDDPLDVPAATQWDLDGPIDKLTEALAKAQGQMGNAPMNRTNPGFKRSDGGASRYADLASIRDATVPALSANGLAITQLIKRSNGSGYYLLAILAHTSGQRMTSEFPLPVEAITRPQQFGSFLTYARRYTWLGLCGIAPEEAEEDDDGNAAQAGARSAPQMAPDALKKGGSISERADPRNKQPMMDPLIAEAKAILDKINEASRTDYNEADAVRRAPETQEALKKIRRERPKVYDRLAESLGGVFSGESLIIPSSLDESA